MYQTRPLSHRSPVLALAALLTLTPAVPAQDSAPGVEIVDTVDAAIHHLLQEAASHDPTFFFAPLKARKVVGHITKTVRYREEIRDIPVYEYETYEVLMPGSSASEGPRKVIKRRIIGVKEGEVAHKTTLVRDPDGPIVREMRFPQYDKSDSNQWSYGTLGMNAAAVFALLQCNVDPLHPVMDANIQELATVVQTFGPPDLLVDLAWMTACFARVPGEEYADLTRLCAGKLLDAQVTAGPGRGMWGPVAINPAVLAVHMKHTLEMAENLEKLRQELREENRDGGSAMKIRKLEDEVVQLEMRIAGMQKDVWQASQVGDKLFLSVGRGYQDLVKLTTDEMQVQVPGIPYLIHNQVTTDLESTALAAFALRVAYENKRIPLASTRPEFPASRIQVPPARQARDTVLLAYQKLLASRLPNGVWNQMNLQQPVTEFAWMESVPKANTAAFGPLPSPANVESLAMGAGAVMNLGIIQQGPEGGGRVLSFPLLQTTLAKRLESGDTEGDILSVFKILPMIGRIRTDGKTEAPVGAWDNLANWLVNSQNSKGGWFNSNKRTDFLSTSILARVEAVPARNGRELQGSMGEPHLSPGLFETKKRSRYYGVSGDLTATTMALMFLADGLPEGWSPEEATLEVSLPEAE